MFSTTARKRNRPAPPRIVTTAGDRERESRSRAFNGAEAMAVMGYTLLVLWGIAYAFGVLSYVFMEDRNRNLVALGFMVWFLRRHRETHAFHASHAPSPRAG